MTLKEAVERGELVPIRCFRVLTNVDFAKVRFNQIQYNRRDIEESVVIPARDRLIVNTYLQRVSGARRFCSASTSATERPWPSFFASRDTGEVRFRANVAEGA